MTDRVIDRAGARVLLIDPDDRVLLMNAFDPADLDAPPYWITVGGGIEEGEDPADAAVRELAEETGLRVTVDDLRGPVFHELVEFPFNGNSYRQTNVFYVVRCDHIEVDTSGWDVVERDSCHGYKWWSVAELSATSETIYPPTLAELIRSVA
jgi:8-oxo-dGTP pyrophosphatase MutT (NUDIX family)